jgi:uncharacterized protein (TIGR03382 family)
MTVTDPTTTGTTTYVPPVDGDGDGFSIDIDCNDANPSVYPGAVEIKGDEIDQDCDGGEICYDDGDDDGSRHATNTRVSENATCGGPQEGRSSDPIDCDDGDPARFIGAIELTGDGIDQDCDGHDACFVDEDGDGYGTDDVVDAVGETCSLADEATDDGDCDDEDPGVNPSASELVADGIDQDCDNAELCYLDSDGDGWGEGTTAWSNDLDCADDGEAAFDGDTCIGFDDNVDPDLDGVPTGCDPCPLDFLDDSDDDGACDSDDLCPGFDDELDSDEDGVPNGCDTCDSPEDSDGDQVPDDCDRCPGFPDQQDADGDGVPDGCDDCASGIDTDGDGVCDGSDVCPGWDDRQDTDGDGIPDGCEDVTSVDSDSDGDGVPDAFDPEPDSPGGAGPERSPAVELGCGCSGIPPAPAPVAPELLALLAAVLIRRRR